MSKAQELADEFERSSGAWSRADLDAFGSDCIDEVVARAALGSVKELLEALKLADALLWGANMNAHVVEEKVRAAIKKHGGGA